MRRPIQEFGPAAAYDPEDLELRIIDGSDGGAWRIFTVAGFEYVQSSDGSFIG